jgi:hypothetical protein
MDMPSMHALISLRRAIAQALGWTLVAGCTDRPLAETSAATHSDGSSEATHAGTTHASGGSTGATGEAVTTGGPAMTTAGTTGSGSTGVHTATTDLSAGTSTSNPGTTTTGESGGTTTTGDGTTDVSFPEPKWDLGCHGWPGPEVGEPLMEVDAEMLPNCVIEIGGFDCGNIAYKCGPRPEGVETCEACDPPCVDIPDGRCYDMDYIHVVCGPYTEGDQCCYVLHYESPCGDGRPLFADGVARVAALAVRADWCAAGAPDLADVSPAARAALARAWTADALAEHASVAAFARFALQLLALGAPPDLVSATHQALVDEVEHARLAFALASAYAGAPRGPGPLPAATAPLAHDLTAVALALVHEGCIGETIAAAQVDLARETATDPAVRAALVRIAADERAHSQLAWRALRWCLARGDAGLRAAVGRAFAAAAPPHDRDRDEPDPDVLRAHGRTAARDRRELARACLEQVIRPAAAALLRANPPADAVALSA